MKMPGIPPGCRRAPRRWSSDVAAVTLVVIGDFEG